MYTPPKVTAMSLLMQNPLAPKRPLKAFLLDREALPLYALLMMLRDVRETRRDLPSPWRRSLDMDSEVSDQKSCPVRSSKKPILRVHHLPGPEIYLAILWW